MEKDKKTTHKEGKKMLDELTGMIHKKTGLTGDNLKAAVSVIGAAFAETFFEMRKPGFTKWTDAINHFQGNINKIRDKRLS